jgi:predicted nucleic acid-binding protein
VPVFVDTNVLVYARDTSDPDKHARAIGWMGDLWASSTGRTSLQVLEEYYVTVTRKRRPGLPRATAMGDVEDLLAWNPAVIDGQVLRTAWSIEGRYGISFWDALVVASASLTGCEHLLTEDLQPGMRFGDLAVVNPFATEPGRLP